MFGRKTEGSIVCPSCGLLVGIKDDECFNCGRRNPGLWGFAPVISRLGKGDMAETFPQAILICCSILFVASLVVDVGGIQMGGMLGFMSPSIRGLFLFGASGAVPVFEMGRWWTFLTASWLHGGLLHIFFNMMWVRQVGPAVIEFYGISRMIIIYTVSGIVGFVASSLAGRYMGGFLGGAGWTIGASASIFGLIAALIYYSRRGGSSIVGQQARMWAIFLFIFGFMMQGVDNWAHLGGFVGGYLSSAWLDPLKPERGDHLLGAFLCLALTALAIVYSVIHGLGLFMASS